MDNSDIVRFILGTILFITGIISALLRAFDENHKNYLKLEKERQNQRLREAEYSILYWREKFEKVKHQKLSSEESSYTVHESVDDIDDLIPASRLKDYTVKLGDDGELIE